MTFGQLSNEFRNKTNIQKNEHRKNFIGASVQIHGTLLAINNDHIQLLNSVQLPWNINLIINYKDPAIYKELLGMTFSDEVKIDAIIGGISFEGDDVLSISCFIKSIYRISTLLERNKHKDIEADIKYKKSRVGRSIGSGIIGFLAGLLIGAIINGQYGIHGDATIPVIAALILGFLGGLSGYYLK